jgi:hypothetical protein
MIVRSLLFLVAIVLSASPAAAELLTRVLFQRGAWAVTYTLNTYNGQQFCNATTANDYGTSFNITLYGDGYATLAVIDDDWDFGGHVYLPMYVVIDSRKPWHVPSMAARTAISFEFNDVYATAKFLKELQAGNAVAVYEEDQSDPFAIFSLSGSRKAIDAVFTCYDLISD